MPDSPAEAPLPDEFRAALDAVRAVSVRSEVTIGEIPSPPRLAPYSTALAADIAAHGVEDLGTGRFVLLYDPDEPEAWGSPFRVVCFAQAPLELEIALDPLTADVTWSWLVDALDSRHARYHSASGTATKTLSTGYGELAGEGSGAMIELRASWSPMDHELTAHVEGWCELLCMLAGLPPGDGDGVSLLAARRMNRGER
ncbi:DUF3000 domain-containing protein [Ruicaihuangia caeni]|uniref:DUF3000 domain-containing protein n=1 Tax=Ruicaihuangia caeni TaxID=3042517 RepID=A0AAW6T3Y1_9MICO|nr:DUF3000 domain-containing protein [Klugiella sp. YN-L-19]MDI2098034.1 DUF3000 domain-containing protein [Klugiella sp. YN-L-19]